MLKNKNKSISHQNTKKLKKSNEDNSNNAENSNTDINTDEDEFNEKIDYNMPKPGPHAKVLFTNVYIQALQVKFIYFLVLIFF